jgi:hypothetical protein
MTLATEQRLHSSREKAANLGRSKQSGVFWFFAAFAGDGHGEFHWPGRGWLSLVLSFTSSSRDRTMALAILRDLLSSPNSPVFPGRH